MKSIIAGLLLFTGFQCVLSGPAGAQVGSACTSWVGTAQFLRGHMLCRGSLTVKSKGLGWSIVRR